MGKIRKQSKTGICSNNSGIALVSVMIVATVCLLVATIVLEITYNSLLARHVYKAASSNSYTSESAVDDMESVIQNIAYYAVSKNQADPDKTFIEVAESTLLEASGATTLNDTSFIADYIYSNLDEAYKKQFGTKNEETGVYTRDSSKFNVSAITKDNTSTGSSAKSLAISVEFTYTNDKGFVTNVSTDLVLNDVTTRKAAADYSLGSYSMFSGGGTLFTDGSGNQMNNGKRNYFKQNGNAYIGSMGASGLKTAEAAAGFAMNQAACLVQYSTVDFAGATIINGDVYVISQSTLIFSAESGTEVTVYGTIYLDEGSVLVIKEGVDFMCTDIKIKQSDGTYKSAFDGTAPVSYDGSSTYKSLFPFDVTDSSQLNTTSENYVIQQFKEGKIGGCVMITVGDNNYVAQYDTTAKKWKYNGSTVGSALINKNSSGGTTAKTTIWTYDNQQVICDNALSDFVDMQVLYWQAHAGNDCFKSSEAYVFADLADTINKQDVTLNLGGAEPSGFYGFGSLTTNDLYTTYRSSAKKFNSQKLALNQLGVSDGTIIVDGNSLDNMLIKFGSVQDEGENVTLGGSDILLGCTWNGYTVQGKGNFCGIAISVELTTYKVNDGKMEAYSILEIPDSEKTDRDALMNSLSSCSMLRYDSVGKKGVGNGANYAYHDDLYKLSMCENLFKGGMKSFTSESEGTTSASVALNSSSMYDFITVENWTQY